MMKANKPNLSGLKSQSAIHIATSKKCRLLANEGTIRSSKTITIIEAFILAVNNSKEHLHLISCKDSDAINDNILDSNNLGILKRYPNLFKLKKDQIGGYYLQFKDTKKRYKKILLCGYDKAPSWSKILGKTIGVILVDEVNIASKQFIDECFSRQASADTPLTLWTLNGDDPSHWIYQEYINYCKPLLREEIPSSILADMDAVENRSGWYYLHWNFKDNPVMTESKIENIKNTYPIGSYYYNVKVLGIRGRSEGSIFAQYIVDSEMLDSIKDHNRIIFYEVGLDIGNNDIKRGTILTLTAIERGYTDAYVIDAYEARSTEANELCNELINKIFEWIETPQINYKLKNIWMDSYGAIQLVQETLQEKIRENKLNINVQPSLKFGDEKGRKARLELMLMLVNQRRIHFNEKSRQTLNSLKRLVYNEKDGLPLDTNQREMDYYDSVCYSLTPHIRELTRLMRG